MAWGLLARKDDVRCSFCDRTSEEAEKLIASPKDRKPRVFICGQCIALCQQVLENGNTAAKREGGKQA